MPKLACRSCGRQIYTVSPLESLFAEERRCPRCGAPLDTERRDDERRGQTVDRTRRTIPGPPDGVERRVATGGGAVDGAASPTEPAVRRPGPRSGCDTRVMSIAFLGFGLIGGSVARALRAGRWCPGATRRLVADRRGPAPGTGRWRPGRGGGDARRRHRRGRTDRPRRAAPRLPALARRARRPAPCAASRPDATITDVASTKGAIVGRAEAHGLRFVGGHPMAGRESTG